MLLDSGTSMDMACNRKYVENVQESTDPVRIATNAGSRVLDQDADMPGQGTMKFHEDGLTNILALSKMKEKGHHVTYDNFKEEAFHVETADRKSVV